MPARRREVAVPQDLGVVVGVDVDEARGEDEAVEVDDLVAGVRGERAGCGDRDDAVADRPRRRPGGRGRRCRRRRLRHGEGGPRCGRLANDHSLTLRWYRPDEPPGGTQRGPTVARSARALRRRAVGRAVGHRAVRRRVAVDRGGRRPRAAGRAGRRGCRRRRRPSGVRRGTLAVHAAGRAGRGAATDRRSPRRADRRHRHPHHHRDGVRHQPGAPGPDRHGGPGVPLLRRPARLLRAGAPDRHRRPVRTGRQRPRRRGGGDRPVERAGHARGVEARAGARRRLHRRLEAAARGAAQQPRPRRGVGGGGSAAGRRQRPPRRSGTRASTS